MALYGNPGNPGNRSPYRTLIVFAGAAIVAVLALIPLLNVYQRLAGPAPTPVPATGKLFEILAQSLDLFDIEYAKVRAGAGPAATGAPDAIARALVAADALSEDFAFSRTPELAALRAALGQLRDGVSQKPPPDLAAPLARAERAAEALRQSTQPTQPGQARP